MTTTNEIHALAEALHAQVARGELLEAFDAYYASDVSMQENLNDPVIGHAKNRERELAFLAGIEEAQSYELHNLAAQGDVTFAESTFRFRATDGSDVTLTQVVRSRWRNGKIVDERFYHG